MIYFYKRFFGIIVSSIMIIILAPLLAMISIAIKIDSKGPIVFKQKRMGYHGKPYNMYKFRSMVVGAQSMGTGLYSFSGDSRITRVGKFLRKTSLDELLQLFNIFKGDMAFVGPRSPVIDGFPNYEDLNLIYKKRFDVLPGITGLAQVVGRNEFAWEEKVKYDNIYIDKIKRYGVFYDIKIIFMTIIRVFSMKNVEENPENMSKNQEAFKSENINSNIEEIAISQNKKKSDE